MFKTEWGVFPLAFVLCRRDQRLFSLYEILNLMLLKIKAVKYFIVRIIILFFYLLFWTQDLFLAFFDLCF